MIPELEEDVREHDAAVASAGVALWIGAEPTFTDRASTEPWWIGEAEGGDKEARARALLLALAPRLGGRARLLRVRGRVYPGEERPRACLGALFERRGPTGATPDAGGLDGPELAAPAPGPEEAWLTVTPDPGVVEVNTAPAHDLATFARWSEAIYAAADAAGLAPARFRYNGDVTDSGGGGQLTLGGPAPDESPFFLRPQLLPRLVRYLNHHPSLSYAFAPDCVGSAGQGPRPDEGARERFDELPIALEWLARRGERATPAELWESLAPLLVDLAGNTHRAELNLEKLWNPHLPGRGRMGVVELRAFRMPDAPEQLVAVAALFRAVAARLASAPFEEPLVDWGGRLHGDFGLPWHLAQDLERVLGDLAAHGLGLGPALCAELRRPPEPILELALGDAALAIAPARSFWPLVGDVASQEHRGARCVDSSSARIQLLLSGADARDVLSAGGWRVPLARLPQRDAQLGSVTYREFAPRPGLHPGIPPSDPLVLEWMHGGRAARIALHGWDPSGAAYDGLPRDAGEARRRRRARVVVSPLTFVPEAPSTTRAADPGRLHLDLRQPTAPASIVAGGARTGSFQGNHDVAHAAAVLGVPPVAGGVR
jgi:uncharacterized protein (DUF2126 family)